MALLNHTSNQPQLLTYLGAHYLASLIANVPSLIGSLAAFGNPLGLMRDLGDGVSDFVNLPGSCHCILFSSYLCASISFYFHEMTYQSKVFKGALKRWTHHSS